MVSSGVDPLRWLSKVRNTSLNQLKYLLSLSLHMVTELERNFSQSTLGWAGQGSRALALVFHSPSWFWITASPVKSTEKPRTPARIPDLFHQTVQSFPVGQELSSREWAAVTKDQRAMFSATVLFPTVGQNGQLLIFYPLRQYYSSKSISPLGLYSIYVHTVLNSESLTLPSPLRNAWCGALMTSCLLPIKSQFHSCPARCPIDPYGPGYTELLGIFCLLSHSSFCFTFWPHQCHQVSVFGLYCTLPTQGAS